MSKSLLLTFLLMPLGITVFSIGSMGHHQALQQVPRGPLRFREVTNSHTTVLETPDGTVTQTTYWPGTRATLDVDPNQLEVRMQWMIGLMVLGGFLAALGLALVIVLLGRKGQSAATKTVTPPTPRPPEKATTMPGSLVAVLAGVPACATELMLLVRQGLTLEEEGKWPEALQAFETVALLAPTDRITALAHERIGELRRKLGTET